MAVTAWGQLYIQTSAPSEPPVQVGSLWADTSGVPAVKVCTAISPYTFSSVGGGGAPSAHATTHQDGGSDEISVTGLSGLLADGQTPLAHAATHKSAGADPIRIDELKIATDVTTLNATSTEHGLLKKLSALTNEFMRGDGTWNPVAGEDLQLSVQTTNNATTTRHGFAPQAVAPASGVRNVIAIDNGETVYKDIALVDSTNPEALGTVAPGTSLIAARRDHVHPIPTNALLDGSAHSDTLAGTVVRGDIIVGNSTPKWARVAKGAANSVLTSDGTDPAWSTTPTVATLTTTGAATVGGLLDLSGASAGQIKFPATQNASGNANTLDDYEEGTWTPNDQSGASLALTNDSGSGNPFGSYVKIGQMVFQAHNIKYPVTADGSTAKIGGFPFTTENPTNAVYWGGYHTFTNSGGVTWNLNKNSAKADAFYGYAPTLTQQTNAAMSALQVDGNIQYRCTA